MGRIKDITGRTVGRLTVLSRAKSAKDHSTRWLCQCACGNTTIVRRQHLVNNATKSCGCLQREAVIRMSTTHNCRKDKLYQVWNTMVHRCHNPKYKGFHNYGARGITVCDEWRASVKTFIKWANKNGYREGLQIDRKNNDGNYEPANCRFTTRTQNQRNTRSNHLLTLNGTTRCMSEWAEVTGINAATIRDRLRRGWTEERALTTPVMK